MKTWMFLFCSLSFTALAAPLETRIDQVTLFADRARVIRLGQADVEAGTLSVEVGPLPAWVDRASIRARVPGAEVLEVQSQKKYLARTPDEDIQKAQNDLEALEMKMGTLQDRLQALQARRTLIERSGEFVTKELPLEVQRRDIPVEYFEDMAKFISEGQLEVDQERRKLQMDMRQLQPELTASRRQLSDMQRGNRLEQLFLTLQLSIPKAGTYPVELVYVLPGATWETVHDARIGKAGEVSLQSLARIRQSSGEDWNNVKLAFSMQQPERLGKLPELESMLLGRKALPGANNPVMQQLEAGWNDANKYYYDNRALYNNVVQGLPDQSQRLQGNFAKQAKAQQRSQQVFTELAERGTSALFEAEGRWTLRSDGSPVRVPFGKLDQQGELQVVAAPEVAVNAARGIRLENEGQPLLPGEVSLFLEGAYIGGASMDFVGPGEEFVLYAGVEDRVKLQRKRNNDVSQLRRGRRQNVMTVQFEIIVENTGDEALPLLLSDRVPVSNEREINVKRISLKPQVQPDEDGLLQWKVTLAAKSRKSFTVFYEVEYPNNLAQMVQKSPSASISSEMQWESSLDSSVDQILNLEKSF